MLFSAAFSAQQLLESPSGGRPWTARRPLEEEEWFHQTLDLSATLVLESSTLMLPLAWVFDGPPKKEIIELYENRFWKVGGREGDQGLEHPPDRLLDELLI